MDKNIGKKLDGRYELTELIGEGGMADVYKAVDVVDNKTVAVKILKKEFAESEEFLRRFRNESKAIAVLSHPNIVKIYDVGFSEKIQFIVMEYIDGITLKEYIENEHVLDWKDAVHFVIQILRALQHAHERGIVHRDIKPQNIMMFTDGTIKVMDFGIAKFAREEGKTATDQAIGTVHYISPEQARGDVTDAKSDLYSVGVMLYEMLTGQKPFDTDNPVSIAVMHMHNQAEAPRSINPNIPVGLEEIIMHAMEKNPEDRYQTAIEMMDDIEKFKADPSIVFGYVKQSVSVPAGEDSPTRYFEAVNDDDAMVYTDDDDYDNVESQLSKNRNYMDEYDEDYSDLDEEEGKEKSLFVPILSAVTVVVIMVAVFFIATLVKGVLSGENNKGDNFAMPNLIGYDYNEAVELYPDLDIQVKEKGYSDLEKDKIYDQLTKEGKKISKNETVYVCVSLGPKTVKVPNVVNYHYKTAGQAIESLGLVVEFKELGDSDVEAELVIKTEPEALSEVEPGSTVLVYVSTGNEAKEIEMDNYVGQDIEDAKEKCGFLGLKVKTKKKDSSEDEGIILEQSIEPGEKVPSDSTITFTVSTGKEPDGTVDMTFYLPSTATGRFTISFYDGSSPIYESLTVAADYSKEAKITVPGKGSKTITAVLNNLSNGMSYEMGKYEMDFEKGEFNTVSEDIDTAFKAVEGVVTQPPATQPPVVVTQPPATQPPATEPPATQASEVNYEDSNVVVD